LAAAAHLFCQPVELLPGHALAAHFVRRKPFDGSLADPQFAEFVVVLVNREDDVGVGQRTIGNVEIDAMLSHGRKVGSGWWLVLRRSGPSYGWSITPNSTHEVRVVS